ncbi:hypothetical protein Ga0074812_1578 [Parafrankia irregularis]|uniref:Uncharacterized protein n=1 Tax=Parafrankia irregularis TaxID=795642 RepID=A0A0S4R154_9ACTN|nr:MULTISPECIES: hypothetical protein [Parafrankia]MBE3206805.1 hypothetical protein [Parafrankia sp. CH37]MBE3206830.1 hypothetical protein [Parafrankia sp. CH37]CUU61118.1 hypothetical protein Ga0074812_1578 [Parafrankia irregularis]
MNAEHRRQLKGMVADRESQVSSWNDELTWPETTSERKAELDGSIRHLKREITGLRRGLD